MELKELASAFAAKMGIGGALLATAVVGLPPRNLTPRGV